MSVGVFTSSGLVGCYWEGCKTHVNFNFPNGDTVGVKTYLTKLVEYFCYRYWFQEHLKNTIQEGIRGSGGLTLL